jgi:NAD dependent epimerase/dehydratase family enzyme
LLALGVAKNMSKIWLAFGLSGPVAQPLYQHLRDDAQQVIAVSRNKRDRESMIEWRQGSLQAPPLLPDEVYGILSLGPLDVFAEWLPQSQVCAQRIIALGSASEIFKANSVNQYDRDVAKRLRMAREALIDYGQQNSVNVCVLRPTLIYGTCGGDSLSRLARMAKRWHLAPIPKPAAGLRQPVHCADVCDVVMQLMRMPQMSSATLDLPGPEAMTFAQMLERNYQHAAKNSLRLPTPTALMRVLMPFAPRVWRSALHRLNEDQVLPPFALNSSISWAPRDYYG